MNSAIFLIQLVFGIYLMLVLLRLWLQFARADFYNPFSQFVVKATHPVVAPLRKIIPAIGRLDTATLVLALLVAVGQLVAISLVQGLTLNPVAIAITAPVLVLREAFQLVFWVLIIRAILSWVSQGRNPIEYVLMQLTEPMLAPIRRIIPPVGGLDLSILILIVAMQFGQLLLLDIFGLRV